MGNRSVTSASGSNGNGASGGSGGVGATVKTWPKEGSGGSTESGGRGGNGGNAGASGSSSSYSTASGTSYTISFDVSENQKAGTVNSITYNSGTSATITMPAYVANDIDVRFLGWQIKTYAKSAVSGSPLTTSSKDRYNAGTVITLDATTFGNIEFIAVTEVVGGIRDEDSYSTKITGTVSETYFTYNVIIKENDTAINKGDITIGDRVVSASAGNVYSIISKDNTTYPIIIDGKTVGYTKPVIDNLSETEINYKSIKVIVEGLVPYSVKLSGENAPVLVDRGNNTFSYTALENEIESQGPFGISVNGMETSQNVSFGEQVNAVFCTLTVTVEPRGIEKNKIERVELKDSDGKMIAMTRVSAEDSKFTYTKAKARASQNEYRIYINGEETDYQGDCLSTRTITIPFSRYKTIIMVELNDQKIDKGTVMLDSESFTRISTGVYQLILTDNTPRTLYIGGQKIYENVTPGYVGTVDFYTINYTLSGERPEIERGNVPKDSRQYLKNSSITLMSNTDLTNGNMTFDGWTINGYTYKPGNTFIITGPATARAKWKRTDVFTGNVIIGTTSYTYNGESQIPDISVDVNGRRLTEGTDYILRYQNTNKTSERNDPNGGSANTINAGTVTITVEGIGDYTGTITKEYIIKQKKIKVQNLTAVDRYYNGTTSVDLNTGRAFLEGVVEGDDVSIGSNLKANTYSEFAKDKKLVIIKGNDLLVGSMLSNYELEAMEPVYVNILPKPITAEMFYINDVTYNAAEQEPDVLAADYALVNSSIKNLFTLGLESGSTKSNDFAVSYSENVHAGEATVKITTVNSITGKLLGNYSGELTLHFTINKAPLEVTANNASSIYGQELIDVTNYYSITSGTVYSEEDRINLALKAYTTVKSDYNIGLYKDCVRIDYNKENTDYEITEVPADYSITKSSQLSVLATGYAGIYDGFPHGIEVKPRLYTKDDTMKIYYSEKELNASNLSARIADSEATTSEYIVRNAGTYKIYYAVVTNNYEPVFGYQMITIGKKKLEVMANNHKLSYGDELNTATPVGTAAAITVNGLEGEDTQAVLGGTLSFTSDNYSVGNDVGTYIIRPEGLTSNNYDITFTTGTLTVEPRVLNFMWSGDNSFVYNANPQGVKVSATNIYGDDKITLQVTDAYKVSVGSYKAYVSGITGADTENYTYLPDDENTAKNYTITQAENSFTVELSMKGWDIASGTLPKDAIQNDPIANAKFGIVTYSRNRG